MQQYSFKNHIEQFTSVTATIVKWKYGHFGPQTLRYLVSDNPKTLTLNLTLTFLTLPNLTLIYYVSQYSEVTRDRSDHSPLTVMHRY